VPPVPFEHLPYSCSCPRQSISNPPLLFHSRTPKTCGQDLHSDRPALWQLTSNITTVPSLDAEASERPSSENLIAHTLKQIRL